MEKWRTRQSTREKEDHRRELRFGDTRLAGRSPPALISALESLHFVPHPPFPPLVDLSAPFAQARTRRGPSDCWPKVDEKRRRVDIYW